MSSYVNSSGCVIKISGEPPIPVVSQGLETIANAAAAVRRLVQEVADTNVLYHITNDRDEEKQPLINIQKNAQDAGAFFLWTAGLKNLAITFGPSIMVILLVLFFFGWWLPNFTGAVAPLLWH